MQPWYRDERKTLLALLAAALLVRVAVAATSPVIAADGARFTLMARYFAAGRWDEGLDVWPRMSPLYSFLLVLFGEGPAVSVVLGALSILPVYALARAVWDRRVAALAAGIVAFHPDYTELGGQVMCESTFCFFFFSAMELLRRAAEDPRWPYWACAGVAGGLAALTRPEGIYVAIACTGWAAVRTITKRRTSQVNGPPAVRAGTEARPSIVAVRRLAGAALTLALFAAVVAPYARWIHEKTGRWDIADSPFGQELKRRLGLSATGWTAPPDYNPFEGARVNPEVEYVNDRYEARYGYLPGRTARWITQVLRMSGYVLFPFLCVGLARLRRRAGDWFVFAVGAGYMLPPTVSLFARLAFTNRYLMPGFLFWSPIVALGIARVGEAWLTYRPRWVSSRRIAVALAAFAVAFVIMRFSTKMDQRFAILLGACGAAVGCVLLPCLSARLVPEPRRALAAKVALAAVALAFFAVAVKPSRVNRRTLIDAGEWIRAQGEPRPVIVTMDRIVGHYAGGYSHAAPARFATLEKVVRAKSADWVVLLSDQLGHMEAGYREAVEAAFPLAHAVPESGRGEEVRIYRAR